MNRRNFLKKTFWGIAGASLMMPALSLINTNRIVPAATGLANAAEAIRVYSVA